jgi:hypothetical protein
MRGAGFPVLCGITLLWALLTLALGQSANASTLVKIVAHVVGWLFLLALVRMDMQITVMW